MPSAMSLAGASGGGRRNWALHRLVFFFRPGPGVQSNVLVTHTDAAHGIDRCWSCSWGLLMSFLASISSVSHSDCYTFLPQLSGPDWLGRSL